MQAAKTIAWVLLTVALVSFIAINWNHVPVNLWPDGDGYIHLEWPVGFVALAFFILGFLPAWIVGRAARWSLARRLENSERQLADMRALANRPVEAAGPATTAPADPLSGPL